MERILTVLGDAPAPARGVVAVLPLGAAEEAAARRMLYELRRVAPAEIVAGDAGLGKKLRAANDLGARFAVILGEDEVRAGRPLLKDMETGEQTPMSELEIIARVAAVAPPTAKENS